ncbi:HSP20-like chaperone [Mycena epipterygia]|nr:HSP20-like chaperone [Mycena epipterygia]
MPPTRTSQPTKMSDSQHRHAIASRKMLDLLDGLSTGRLRLVDRPLENAVFCPRLEIYDDPESQNIVATFELPGVKISDLTISVQQENLEIRGQRLSRYGLNRRRHPSLSELSLADAVPAGADAESNIRFFPCRELRYGAFYRKLRLPSGADVSCISASLSDGLLTVSWPRAPLREPISSSPRVLAADSFMTRATSSVRSGPHGAPEHSST